MYKTNPSRSDSGGELGVARWRESSLQVFDDVEWKTADQGDGGNLPQERPGGDEGQVWRRRKRRDREAESLWVRDL